MGGSEDLQGLLGALDLVIPRASRLGRESVCPGGHAGVAGRLERGAGGTGVVQQRVHVRHGFEDGGHGVVEVGDGEPFGDRGAVVAELLLQVSAVVGLGQAEGEAVRLRDDEEGALLGCLSKTVRIDF